MPVYDFVCRGKDGGCGHEERNVFFITVAEYEEAVKDGYKCPKCGQDMMQILGGFKQEFAPTHDVRGKKYPGSKREMRQMMKKRYDERNKRLDNLPPDQKKRMKRFFNKHGIRRTPPSEPPDFRGRGT